MDTLTTGAFVLGLTQLIKDSGIVKGRWLQLVAVLLGGLATYAQMFQPELWHQLSAILIAVGVTGGVSYTNEKAKQLSPAA